MSRGGRCSWKTGRADSGRALIWRQPCWYRSYEVGRDGASAHSSVLLRVRRVGYKLEYLAIRRTEMLPEIAVSAFSALA